MKKGAGVIFAALLAGQASAQDVTAYGWGDPPVTWVKAVPSEKSGVWIEIVFKNENIHPNNLERLEMSYQGVEFDVVIYANRAFMKPDRMKVELPDGFSAEPESISVEEGETGTILVYPPVS